jgi:hypothetical protein
MDRRKHDRFTKQFPAACHHKQQLTNHKLTNKKNTMRNIKQNDNLYRLLISVHNHNHTHTQKLEY